MRAAAGGRCPRHPPAAGSNVDPTLSPGYNRNRDAWHLATERVGAADQYLGAIQQTTSMTVRPNITPA
jgi:hypothetical protein